MLLAIVATKVTKPTMEEYVQFYNTNFYTALKMTSEAFADKYFKFMLMLNIFFPPHHLVHYSSIGLYYFDDLGAYIFVHIVRDRDTVEAVAVE